MAVGHSYYFLEDIFPNQPGGWKILKTPQFLRLICDPAPEVNPKFHWNKFVFNFDFRTQPTTHSQRTDQVASNGDRTRRMRMLMEKYQGRRIKNGNLDGI